MIELEEARGLLARAVLTQGPDFRYNNTTGGRECWYLPLTPNDEIFASDPRCCTGCLIGTALKLSGVEVAEWPGSIEYVYDLDKDGMQSKISQEVARYFQRAQTAQDDGRTWGEAYAAAERSLS